MGQVCSVGKCEKWLWVRTQKKFMHCADVPEDPSGSSQKDPSQSFPEGLLDQSLTSDIP